MPDIVRPAAAFSAPTSFLAPAPAPAGLHGLEERREDPSTGPVAVSGMAVSGMAISGMALSGMASLDS